MLVNCPKCGFTQPKDNYCAQCGVNMSTFRASSDRAWKKWLRSPAFHLTTLSLFLVLGGTVLLSQWRWFSPQEVTSSNSNLPQISRSLTAATPPAPETHKDSNLPPVPALNESLPTTPPPAEANASSESLTAEREPSNLATPASAKSDASKEPESQGDSTTTPNTPKIRITFAEIALPALERIYEASRESGQFNQFGDYDAGISPRMADHLSSRQGVKVLHQEQRSLNGSPLQTFWGLHSGDPDREIGLSLILEKQDSTEAGSTKISLEINRSWRERSNPSDPPSLQRRNFPALFELPKGYGFFMAGLLPRNIPPEVENLISVPPFQIFRSGAFRSSQSEMVLIIDFAP